MSIAPSKSELPDPWPFDQPPNCATFTTTHVMKDNQPIIRVCHDEDDHGWQFHSDHPAEMKYAMLVCLKEVYFHDPTVLEVANLPPGWVATRNYVGDIWIRKKNE